MNAPRRKAIQEMIETIKDEEQEAFDNLPENLQGSDRGEAMEAAADNLDSAFNGMDEVLDYLTYAIEG